jgi:hypothetical protein
VVTAGAGMCCGGGNRSGYPIGSNTDTVWFVTASDRDKYVYKYIGKRVESAAVCNHDGGIAVVMGCRLITPAEVLYTQEMEVKAAYGGSFEQTLFSFFISIFVIIWIFS